jgi:hypothetical protein
VPGAHLLLRLELADDDTLIALLQLLWRQGRHDLRFDIGIAERLLRQELQPGREGRALVEAGIARRLGEELHVDQRVDDDAALLLLGHPAEFGAEFLAGDRHLRFGDLAVADARHHRIRVRCRRGGGTLGGRRSGLGGLCLGRLGGVGGRILGARAKRAGGEQGGHADGRQRRRPGLEG